MKSKFTMFIIVLILSLTISGCGPSDAEILTLVASAWTPTSEATETPQPTETLLPTETPKPTNTPLPEGIIFRDDFDGDIQPEWEWENENSSKWTITDEGWLQIIGEHEDLLYSNYQNNLLWRPLPAGDFVITVHLKTKPFENFQQTAIFIYEDAENYVTINRGYCDLCQTSGGGFYMDYKIDGQIGNYNSATEAEDVYLRLESKDNIISGYYSTAPDQWERLGRFGNYFQFQKVGIGVSNGRAGNDVVGMFDFFEISVP